MLHGTTPYEGNHAHEHNFRDHNSEIEADRNHFIVYDYCNYYEVTNSVTDHARDEVYEEVGYECETARTTYLEYNWFVRYDTGEVITYDEQPDLFEQLCAELEKCVAGERTEEIGDMWLTLDESATEGNAPQFHARLTYKSTEVS
jgi:hypothetical protein